jgi:putative N-acetylmannosamine-6-phosphate epimerase
LLIVPPGLVVSCQGPTGTPLDDPGVMAAMAQVAQMAGAVAIRAQGVADIRRICEVVSIPIIGLLKREVNGERRITLSVDDALLVAEAGAEVIAVDLTRRPRPDGLTPEAFMGQLARAIDLPILADVSTVDEGVVAAGAGAACVSSTMSGYTSYSPQLAGPDLGLVAALVKSVSVPVFAEGRYRTPEQASEAFRRGAYGVVVGTAITNTLEIARWFADAYREVLHGGSTRATEVKA